MHSLYGAPPSRSLMLLKLNMEKAYDWAFEFKLLTQYGLNEGFIKLIQAIMLNTSCTLLINGSPSYWFSLSKDLKQGCHLSPYLFILCSEVFS